MSKPDSPATTPRLNHGFTFAELRTQAGLERLDRLFLERLRAHDVKCHDALLACRHQGGGLPAVETSELLLAAAPLLDELVAEVFGIQKEMEAARQQTLAHDPVFQFKKEFVLKRARRRLNKKEEIEDFAELDTWLAQALKQAGHDDVQGSTSATKDTSAGMREVEQRKERLPGTSGAAGTDRELAVARLGQQLLRDETANADAVERLTRWCVRALTAPEGRRAVHGWAGFQMPQPREYHKLVPIVPLPNDPAGRVQGPPEHFSRRDGFGLTDKRFDARAVQAEVHYCIYCHDHDGDFCSKGFPGKEG